MRINIKKDSLRSAQLELAETIGKLESDIMHLEMVCNENGGDFNQALRSSLTIFSDLTTKQIKELVSHISRTLR